jgi:hypothetical protein
MLTETQPKNAATVKTIRFRLKHMKNYVNPILIWSEEKNTAFIPETPSHIYGRESAW